MKPKPSKFSKVFSTFLTFFLLVQLMTGIFLFVPKPQIARAVTALTNVTDTPTSTKISTSTSHKIDFTTYTTVPVDGKIVITFPAGFNVASAAFSAWSGFDGNKTVSVSGQVVTVTRTTGGTASTAGGKYITLSGITNTATIETNYTVTVETQNSAAATLDGPTTSYYFSICANACHTATYQIPWSSTVSVSGKHTTKFTTASAIPADGKIKLTFPSGFDVSGATFDSWSDFDGGESLVINGQTITLTRDNTGTSKAAGAKYIVLNNIINHTTAGSVYYATVETLTNGEVNIEGPTGMRFSISNTGLGLADGACPLKGCNLKNTNRTTFGTPVYSTVKWVYTTAEPIHVDGLMVGKDDILYINTINDPPGGYAAGPIYAINPDGSLKWKKNTVIPTDPTLDLGNRGFKGGLSQGQDGSLYTSFNSGIMYKLNANTGDTQWIYAQGASNNFSYSRPTIWQDGTVFITDRYGYMNALNPDGTLKWRTRSSPDTGPGGPGGYFNGPVIGDDEKIYTNQTRLGLDGTIDWTWSFGSDLRSGISIGPDGNLYFPYAAFTTRVVNKNDGSSVATSTRRSNGMGASGMAVDDDGTLFFTQYSPTIGLVALNPDFSEKWSYSSSELSGNSLLPLIDDSYVYFSAYSTSTSKYQVFILTKDGQFKAKIPSSTVRPGSDGTLYGYDYNSYYIYAFQPWTLTSSLNRSDYYNPGDTITFTATTSMLTTDPVTAEANQAQVYLSDGTIVPLTYASTNSSGNTVWTGTHTISSGKPDGIYTATFEAASVNVETDTATHFASAPTNTNNTGITSALSYTVKKQSASAPSLDAPRPPDLPNSPEPVLADADQKPTPPKASKYNPSGGFDLLLNGGAKETSNPEVSLYLFGGPDTKYMQISEDPTFKGAKQEIYTPHKHYKLKDNKLGKHTIYIRYFTLYDVPSETVSQSILLTKTTPPDSPPSQATIPSVPICTTTIIKTGDTLWDLAVRYFTEGSLYPNLINLNKDAYSSLVTNPGYLRLGWEIKVECK